MFSLITDIIFWGFLQGMMNLWVNRQFQVDWSVFRPFRILGFRNPRSPLADIWLLVTFVARSSHLRASQERFTSHRELGLFNPKLYLESRDNWLTQLHHARLKISDSPSNLFMNQLEGKGFKCSKPWNNGEGFYGLSRLLSNFKNLKLFGAYLLIWYDCHEMCPGWYMDVLHVLIWHFTFGLLKCKNMFECLLWL